MARTRDEGLQLGEWAWPGILAASASHGDDVAARRGPAGDIGCVGDGSTLGRTTNPVAAQAFVDGVLSDQGRQVLDSYGFGAP